MSHSQQRHPANGSTTTFATPLPPSTTSPTTPTSDRHRPTPPVRHSQRFRVTSATTSSPKTNFFDLNLHQRRQTRFATSRLTTTSQPPHQHFHQTTPTLPNPYHNSPNAAESLSSIRHSPSTNSGLKFTNQTKQINRLVFTSPNPDSLGMPTVNLNTFTHNALWNLLAT